MQTFSLDFGEDDVNVGSVDVLAIHDLAILAELGPVLPVHFLSGGLGVSMDRETTERAQQRLRVHGLCHHLACGKYKHNDNTITNGSKTRKGRTRCRTIELEEEKLKKMTTEVEPKLK